MAEGQGVGSVLPFSTKTNPPLRPRYYRSIQLHRHLCQHGVFLTAAGTGHRVRVCSLVRLSGRSQNGYYFRPLRARLLFGSDLCVLGGVGKNRAGETPNLLASRVI